MAMAIYRINEYTSIEIQYLPHNAHFLLLFFPSYLFVARKRKSTETTMFNLVWITIKLTNLPLIVFFKFYLKTVHNKNRRNDPMKTRPRSSPNKMSNRIGNCRTQLFMVIPFSGHDAATAKVEHLLRPRRTFLYPQHILELFTFGPQDCIYYCLYFLQILF